MIDGKQLGTLVGMVGVAVKFKNQDVVVTVGEQKFDIGALIRKSNEAKANK